jgi:prepilin-type N-terminal cleavage/methylation domain-containing protein
VTSRRNVNWNENGFGLIEILVSLGIAGLMAMLLMRLSEQQNNQQRKAVRDVEITEA